MPQSRNRRGPRASAANLVGVLLLVTIIIVAVILVFYAQKRDPEPPDPAVVEAMNRGVSLMGQYQYGPAVEAFEEALQKEPSQAEAKVNLAISLFNRSRKEDQDLDRAGKLLEEVLAENPENLRALYFRGIVLQHIGKAEAAIPCFEKVTRERPDDGVAWYLLGLCKVRLERPAEKELLQAVSLRPHLYSAYYQLYQSAIRSGDLQKAKSYLKTFTTLRASPLGEAIELPQYNQMGKLALAQPLAPLKRAGTSSRWAAATPRPFPKPRRGLRPQPPGEPTNGLTAPGLGGFGGFAIGDVDHDGRTDVLFAAAGPGTPSRVILMKGDAKGGFSEFAPDPGGLEAAKGALAIALGDYDNDGKVDLFAACAETNFLFRGNGDGSFVDVTGPTGTGTGIAVSKSAIFVDADHDGDLDLLVCNVGVAETKETGGCQLLNNNADGTFTDITEEAGLECAGSRCVMALPGDLDGDRDADLVVLRAGAPAKLFLNELSGRYREIDAGAAIRGDLGGALQDFNGDGKLDLLVLGKGLRLFSGDGRGHFTPHEPFDDCADSAASWGPVRGFRVADVDLDGDLDIAIFGQDGRLLLNTGTGTFVLQAKALAGAKSPIAAAELLDLTGDLVPDLVRIDSGPRAAVVLTPGQLTPPSTGLAIMPTGKRGRDGRTRSSSSGYGVRVLARTGLHEQTLVRTGQAGGANQSLLPLIIGLGGATKTDYVDLNWPDGVAQVEIGLEAGKVHRISETQRKISSCPVLFAWNGQRFEFVTDFAGVGGLGYYAGPGEYSQPQVLEHVKIEPGKLQPRGGRYELRVTEPMEETAYVDRLELLAIDHPQRQEVFPDEYLAVSGPPPSHELLVTHATFFPKEATGPDSQNCTERLRHADRTYAYQPPLDRRFCGFCRPHSVELDFGTQVADLPLDDPVYLFIRGYIEFPYSQTVYAAAQPGIGWEPIRVERLDPGGRWTTIVPDAGAPGGMDRTMTVALTGRLAGPTCKLRLTTNLEIYYDQIFIARHAGLQEVRVSRVPLIEADLRKVGFAREYSPDGRMPLLYDYHRSDYAAPFHVLKGSYTRYGPVKELLAEFDDRYVLVGPGDEIALQFDAAALPAVAPGQVRSFILVSHAYCKDMDLYTASPQTLEPLPFRGMTRYPYPPDERYPDTRELRHFRATYNTRIAH